ncbi:hypothetical protein HMPREF1261_01924 [Corynebacterium sp. KPL1818]|jgi:two component system sensor kinase|uniref:sensor histidine kinase n=1 Tax=Corynebacterium TaxID=1716 RepID=UPI0003B8A20F|nr:MULTISPECIES: sensor histidine kinase [Corynebacterium]ERS58908.1 hypothetical protein HMPREF1261_01924 [Corynebacterium sp. KPL1818]MDK4209805.1 sensor histidine kinase [Corynebacterium accolens]
MDSFHSPFKGFATNNAVFASVWLIFLLFGLILSFAQPGVDATQRLGSTACVIAFSALYFFSFGSVTYYPRGWNLRYRLAARWSALALIALISIPFFGVYATTFVPYLAAFLGFQLPLRRALLWVLLTGLVVTGALWSVDSQDLLGTFIVIFGWPILLVLLGTMSQREDSRTDLEHQLDLARQREDIATDVHDLLGHSLTVINLKSELAQRLVDVDPTRARNELQEISDLSRKSLAEVRSTVTRMRMPTFEGEVQAARRAFDTTGIQAHLPANVQAVGLYDAAFSWALRELTTNVIRHSGAQHCWVSITQNKLQVVDDGCGFDPKKQYQSGGLHGLHKRMKDSGGKLIIMRKDDRTVALITMNGDTELLPLDSEVESDG